MTELLVYVFTTLYFLLLFYGVLFLLIKEKKNVFCKTVRSDLPVATSYNSLLCFLIASFSLGLDLLSCCFVR